MIKVFGEDNKNIVMDTAQAVLKYFSILEDKVDIEINFTTPTYIKELNKKYRAIDEVTDVLSFSNIQQKYPYDFGDYSEYINPEDGSLLLGEIFICLERAKHQAKQYGNTADSEIRLLVIHSILHLLGYNHSTPEDATQMETLQDEITKGIERL